MTPPPNRERKAYKYYYYLLAFERQRGGNIHDGAGRGWEPPSFRYAGAGSRGRLSCRHGRENRREASRLGKGAWDAWPFLAFPRRFCAHDAGLSLRGRESHPLSLVFRHTITLAFHFWLNIKIHIPVARAAIPNAIMTGFFLAEPLSVHLTFASRP